MSKKDDALTELLEEMAHSRRPVHPDGTILLGPEQTGEPSCLALRVVDGVEVVLYAMLFGNTRLCIGEPGAGGFDRGWCYQARHFAGALVDATTWDGVGDSPPGPWYKSLQTGEKRAEYEGRP